MRRYIQTNSIIETQRWYRSTYGPLTQSGDSIRKLNDHFLRYGTVADLQRSGRPRIRSDDVRKIENVFNENPRLSTMNAERELGIPRSTIRDVLKKKLKMFLYKISFLQHLLARDYVDRLNLAQHCPREIRRGSQYLSRIGFSDECLFQTKEL